MKKDLRFIQDKISAIQFGILKTKDIDGNKSWQVKAAPDQETSFHCVITDDRPCEQLVNSTVNLVQKHNDDYLYITGRVSAEADKKSKILSVSILKAAWFVRQSKGKISWLKQKYLYENYTTEDMELAS
ncbi:MAG: hypothetical protein EOO05_03330 [Chitinophagaceae bacterium]|nr:MAG: hypothetical protein EOO05_03330 [Chitinophagaceae bacterium]